MGTGTEQEFCAVAQIGGSPGPLGDQWVAAAWHLGRAGPVRPGVEVSGASTSSAVAELVDEVAWEPGGDERVNQDSLNTAL